MEEQEKVPFYKKTWFIILAIIFFFPVGLYLMWAHTDWHKAAKWIVTGAIALVGVNTLLTEDDTQEVAEDETEEIVASEEDEQESTEPTSNESTSEESTDTSSEESTEEQSSDNSESEETTEAPAEEESEETAAEETESSEQEESTEAQESSEEAAEEEADETVAIGETLTVDDIDFTVNEWFERDAVGNALSATANDTFLVLDVSVTNNQNEAVMMTSNFFEIVDGEVVYEPDGTASTYMNQEIAPDNTGFLAEEINPGSSRDAYIVYDVAPQVIESDSKALKVQSGVFATQTGTITLQ